VSTSVRCDDDDDDNDDAAGEEGRFVLMGDSLRRRIWLHTAIDTAEQSRAEQSSDVGDGDGDGEAGCVTRVSSTVCTDDDDTYTLSGHREAHREKHREAHRKRKRHREKHGSGGEGGIGEGGGSRKEDCE
jgi:hypothetical protein